MHVPIGVANADDFAGRLAASGESSALTDSSRLPEYLPAVVVGWIVAAGAAALVAGFIEPIALTPSQIRNVAAIYVLFTAGLGWATSYAGCRWLRAGDPEHAHTIARLTAAVAVWFAPMAVLARDASEWSLLVAIILVGSVTRLSTAFLAFEHEPRPAVHDILTLPPTAKTRVPEYIAAVLLGEVSILAIASAHAVLASLSVGTATWILLRRYDEARVEAVRSKVLSARIAGRLSTASLLTVIALVPHLLVWANGSYAVAGGSHWSIVTALKVLLGYVPGHPGTATAATPEKSTARDDYTGVISGPVFPGIVLYGDPRVTELVAPPVSAEAGMSGDSRTEPYVIPFRGVYWILRRPDLPPPKTSLVMRGSPAKRTFTSNDYQPLWMEAHDNLGTLIDVRCCSAVKLEVTDNDSHAENVRIELLLENTRQADRWVSLGVVTLENSLGDRHPAQRTLTFQIPRVPRIREFNRFTVRYELRGSHSYWSARIAVDDFVLVPQRRPKAAAD